jgi:predicted PurR-regulated permease PerM
MQSMQFAARNKNNRTSPALLSNTIEMKFNVRYLLAIIPLAIFATVLYYLGDIVTYILLAWVISMIGAPVVVFLRKYLGKNLAAIITLSLFVAIFGFLIWIFIPPLASQLENLSKLDYDKVVTALEEPIKDWEKWLVSKKILIPEALSEGKETKILANDANIPAAVIQIDSSITGNNIGQGKSIQLNIYVPEAANQQDSATNTPKAAGFFDKLRIQLSTYLNPVYLQALLTQAMNQVGDVMVAVFSVFFIGFFFLREQGLFVNMLMAIVPIGYEQQTANALDQTSRLLIRYFIGILIQMTLITIIVSSGLAIFGIPNALLIGFFAGMMNVIPYVGPIIATVAGVAITLSSSVNLSFYDETIPLIVRLLGVFFITRLIDDVVLQPNIFSKSVKAHPLEIFIIVLIGAKIAGILGMVLAIPFYTAFRVVGKEFLSEFKVIQKLTRNL